jgi:hypothetical protein
LKAKLNGNYFRQFTILFLKTVFQLYSTSILSVRKGSRGRPKLKKKKKNYRVYTLEAFGVRPVGDRGMRLWGEIGPLVEIGRSDMSYAYFARGKRPWIR